MSDREWQEEVKRALTEEAQRMDDSLVVGTIVLKGRALHIIIRDDKQGGYVANYKNYKRNYFGYAYWEIEDEFKLWLKQK